MEKIHDPKIREYARGIGAKGISSRKINSMLRSIASNIQEGNRTAALDNFGDIWDSIDETKKAGLRLQGAKTFLAMRDGLEELKTDYGIDTGRVFAAFTANMSKAEFSAGIKNFSVEFVGGVDLTDEQKAAAQRIQTYINSQLVSFLHMVSGAAVTEQEFARIRAMFPGIFQEEAVNVGTIDGNIDFLKDSQFFYYTDHSDEDFAAEVMAIQGWDNIRTSKDVSVDLSADPLVSQLAMAAASEEEFVEKMLKLHPGKDKELREIYQSHKEKENE